MHNVLIFLFYLVFLSGYEVHGSWVPIMPSLGADSRRIELGDNGRRMAVGTSDNSISIYDLVTTPVHDNDDLMLWKFIGHLNGTNGAHFSLLPDGRFLSQSSRIDCQISSSLGNCEWRKPRSFCYLRRRKFEDLVLWQQRNYRYRSDNNYSKYWYVLVHCRRPIREARPNWIKAIPRHELRNMDVKSWKSSSICTWLIAIQQQYNRME